jgi:hypothetical protein
MSALVWAAAAAACNVPVYRYALERWEADPYVIAVFHRGPLTAEQQAAVEAMETMSKDGLANVVLIKADLADKVPENLQALWNQQVKAELPWMVVKYPPPLGVSDPVWAGPLSAEAVKALLDSPARREIARSLSRGETASLLLLESGNRKRDDAAAHLLETEARKLEQTLELPELDPSDPEMNTNLVSKVAFSIVRVSRSNPAERMFVNMLVNVDTNLASATEAMLFPVFGRGRALPPATGDEIQAEAIGAMAGFLAGACSCQVKEMNPGYDLLLAVDWGAIFEGAELKDVELPPLVSLSQFASAAGNPPKAASNAPAAPAALAAAVPATAGSGGSLVRNLLIVLGAGVVLITAATFALRSGSRKPPL